MRIVHLGERWSWSWKVEGQRGRRHEEGKHHRRYGRGYKTVEVTNIMSNPRIRKLGTLNQDDDDFQQLTE